MPKTPPATLSGVTGAFPKGDYPMKYIYVDDCTRIARIDKLNWTVQVLRNEPSGQVWRQANGNGKGPFAGKPNSPVIVSWLLDNAPELDGFEGTLAEYTKAVDKAGRRIAKSIAESNGEVW